MGRLGSAVSCLCVLSACTLSTEVTGTPGADGSAAVDGGGGGLDGSMPDRDGTVPPRDAPMVDAPGWDAGIDAGPSMPTAVMTVAMSGTRQAHPAVAWDGSRFVVGVIAATSATTGRVETFSMLPGDVTPLDRSMVTTGGRERGGVRVAVSPGGLVGVGWKEWDGGEWDAVVAVLPSDPIRLVRINAVGNHDDHPSLEIAWDGESLHGAFRDESDSELFPATFHPSLMVGMTAVTSASGMQGTAMRSGPNGPLLVCGTTGEVFERDGSWDRIYATAAPSLQEAALTVLGDGSALVLFTDTETALRRVFAVRLDPSGSPWSPAFGLRDTDLRGPDPALDTAGDRAIVAYVDESSGDRIAALASLTRDGEVDVGPCLVPRALGYANDPSIACGGGWCAVVWIEGSDGAAEDFEARVIQVPAEPALVCP